MLAVVILAAGKGTRMKSPWPKVLHLLAGEPLIVHVLETALKLSPARVLVVLGHKAHLVREVLKNYAVDFVFQKEQLGTGHAVLVTAPYLKDFSGEVMVLCGDVPLLTAQTLKELVTFHRKERAMVTLLTAELEDPTGYGRIVRAKNGVVERIVEEKDASPEEKRIKEINAGTYLFDKDFLFEALSQIRPQNVQGEYYLTDAVALAQEAGKKVSAFKVSNNEEILGVNSQFELARAEAIFQRKLREKFMANGVTFIRPESVYLERKVHLSPGAIIYPFVSLRGATFLAEGVVVEPHCDLKDVEVAAGAKIKAGSFLQGTKVPPPVEV